MDSATFKTNTGIFGKRHLNSLLGFLPAAMLSGLLVIVVMSLAHISSKISIPYACVVSVIVFSLASYYSSSTDHVSKAKSEVKINKQLSFHNVALSRGALCFALVYSAFLIILIVTPNSRGTDIFAPWQDLTIFDLFQLVTSIGISVYLPGFALIHILDKRNQISRLGKHLVGYIFSVIISGFIGFVIAIAGQPFEEYNALVLALYSIILILYTVTELKRSYNNRNLRNHGTLKGNSNGTLLNFFGLSIDKFWLYIVFASLLGFVLLSSYYLFGTTLVGDQLYHHGKTLTFTDGTFKNLLVKGLDIPYLPLMHGFLSTIFSLSGIPSVNVYVAIGFLNIMPVFAFYYFFSRWFPYKQRASILAACLFMIGSGYGWAHVISLTTNEDARSAFELIELGGRNTFDIRQPASFLNNGTITKPIVLFGLPFGLVLLGLIKENWQGKTLLVSIICVITIGGLLSHEEFVLFLVVAFLVHFVFRFTHTHYFFGAVAISVLAVSICIGMIFPSDFQVTREVLGIPFTLLLLIITLVLWSAYIARSRFNKITRIRLPASIKTKIGRRSRLVTALAIIAIISYLYVYTFVTWSQIPFAEVHAQVAESGSRVIPWYLYPMRLGVPGMLGLVYLLSYFFRKYERETFVFLIIALIALVFTPFYNEHRLNNYVMLSADGLTALLVYRIVSRYIDQRKIVTGFVLAAVIVFSGMSIIMYQGYVDLALQDPEASFFLSHRYLPQDTSLLNFLHTNTDAGSENVAVPNDFEHSFRRHHPGSYLAEQIEGYAGIPLESRLSQASTILQSSTLEGVFSLLNYSNTRFIVFPIDYINDGLTNIGEFLLNSFPRVYDGRGGTIVSVPNLTQPRTPSQVSVVLPKTAMANSTEIPFEFRPVKDITSLGYTNLSQFAINGSIDGSRAYMSNNSNTISLEADSSGTDLWFEKFVDKDPGHFEVNLKVNSSQGGAQNHAGMLLEFGNRTYYIFLRPHSVSAYNPNDKEFARNNAFIRNDDVWHNLKIVSGMGGDRSYHVLVNNTQLLTLPRLYSDEIMRIGLRALNTVTEFSPVVVGKPLDESFLSPAVNSQFNRTMEYYYPVSLAALAQMNYSTYFDGDLAIASTNPIILTYDPQNIHEYLKYIHDGQTVAVFNSEMSFAGGFGKFLDIKPIQLERFKSIDRNQKGTTLDLQGNAMNVKVGSPGSRITSFYNYDINDNVNRTNDPLISSSSTPVGMPLSIEKDYGKGKIIYINAKGLFDAIERRTRENDFMALGTIPKFLGLDYAPITYESPIQISPPGRFIGGMQLSGNITITGTSLFFPIDNDFTATNVRIISDKGNESAVSANNKSSSTSLRNLTFSGPFMLKMKTSDVDFMPTMSPNAYGGFALSDRFDMEIQPKTLSPVIVEYYNGSNSSEIARSILTYPSRLHFESITSGHLNAPPIAVMIKNPIISVNGKTQINDLYLRKPNNPSSWLSNGETFTHEGNLTLGIGHTEKFRVQDNPILYASYLDFIEYDKEYQHQKIEKARYQKLSWPGDISSFAKENDMFIPLGEVISSELNKKVAYTFTIVGIVSIFLFWGKIKKLFQNDQSLSV